MKVTAALFVSSRLPIEVTGCSVSFGRPVGAGIYCLFGKMVCHPSYANPVRNESVKGKIYDT